jgi:hypothetical protein
MQRNVLDDLRDAYSLLAQHLAHLDELLPRVARLTAQVIPLVNLLGVLDMAGRG